MSEEGKDERRSVPIRREHSAPVVRRHNGVIGAVVIRLGFMSAARTWYLPIMVD